MNCTYCGTENQENSKFCNECGQPLTDMVSQNKNMGSPKRRTVAIAVVLAVVAVVFAVVFSVYLLSGSTEDRLKGTWVRDNSLTGATDTVVYTFTKKGGTNTYNSQNLTQPAGEASFDWYVTEDNELILLWSNTSCVRYIWNPDFSSYGLSTNEYDWCLKGDKLYLSSTSSDTGYHVYTR